MREIASSILQVLTGVIVLVAVLVLLPGRRRHEVGHLDAIFEEVLLDRMRPPVDFDDGTIAEILAEQRSVDRR